MDAERVLCHDSSVGRLLALVAVLGITATTAASAAPQRLPTIGTVKAAFAQQGQPLHTYNPSLASPSWAKLRAHLRGALVNNQHSSRTFSALFVWVFDSSTSAREAQRAEPSLAERRPTKKVTATSTIYSGFVHRQANIIVSGGYDRWHATFAALEHLH